LIYSEFTPTVSTVLHWSGIYSCIIRYWECCDSPRVFTIRSWSAWMQSLSW